MQVRTIGITLLLAYLASPAYAMDLQHAWQAAQTKDPQFSAARAGGAAGQFRLDQARALKLPQVNAMAGTGVVNAYNKISNAQFSASGLCAADLRWNISAEQALYNAERASMAEQLQKQAQFVEAQFSSEEQLLILRLSKTCFDQLLAAVTLASVKQQRQAVAQALAVAQGRFQERLMQNNR
jgi:outer membrane protein TolC